MYALAKIEGQQIVRVKCSKWFRRIEWLEEYCASIKLEGMQVIEGRVCNVYKALTPDHIPFYLLSETTIKLD